MIEKLPGRIPQYEAIGIYAWDDMVTDKINEIIAAVNMLIDPTAPADKERGEG